MLLLLHVVTSPFFISQYREQNKAAAEINIRRAASSRREREPLSVDRAHDPSSPSITRSRCATAAAAPHRVLSAHFRRGGYDLKGSKSPFKDCTNFCDPLYRTAAGARPPWPSASFPPVKALSPRFVKRRRRRTRAVHVIRNTHIYAHRTGGERGDCESAAASQRTCLNARRSRAAVAP